MTTATQLAKLREPFAEHQIGLLPKQVRSGDQDKGKCDSPRSRYSADGKVCGGWHARSVHLDYVGHAALTDRFLAVDPEWSWEPIAFGPDGLPAFDREGGLWIKLTLCGVTRLGYGDAQGKKGPNAIKEAIGDALRNAGMRFGAALDLWHKGDLHDASEQRGNPAEHEGPSPENTAPADPADALVVQQLEELIDGATTTDELVAIGQDIAKSAISGPEREALRRKYSDRRKAVAA